MQTTKSSSQNNSRQYLLYQNTLNTSFKYYKRLTNPHQLSNQYNTIKKYNQHNISSTDHQSNGKSGQWSQGSANNQCHADEGHQIGELSVIEEQMSVCSSSLPLTLKFKSLLKSKYEGANFTTEQRKIIQIQIKLDEMLDYLRQHRNKQKGQFLSQIIKIMLINYEIIFELQHFKQILFINPNLYIWNEKKDEKGRFDILISLPQDSQLQQRRQQFRKLMYKYVQQNDGFNDKKKIKIPSINISLIIKQQQKKKQLSINHIVNHNYFWINRSFKQGKINPFDALKPGNRKNFQQMLINKIRQNQQRIKNQKLKQNTIVFGSKQLLAVFDQLPKIYKKTDKCSLFKSSIIQNLDHSLNIKQEVLCKIFQVLLMKYPYYFKVISHKNGQIIQIQRKYYNQIRLLIQKTSNDQNDNQNKCEINLPINQIANNQNENKQPQNQKKSQKNNKGKISDKGKQMKINKKILKLG